MHNRAGSLQFLLSYFSFFFLLLSLPYHAPYTHLSLNKCYTVQGTGNQVSTSGWCRVAIVWFWCLVDGLLFVNGCIAQCTLQMLMMEEITDKNGRVNGNGFQLFDWLWKKKVEYRELVIGWYFSKYFIGSCMEKIQQYLLNQQIKYIPSWRGYMVVAVVHCMINIFHYWNCYHYTVALCIKCEICMFTVLIKSMSHYRDSIMQRYWLLA